MLLNNDLSGVIVNVFHHAFEGQRMKLVGVNLLEQLLMTTAAQAKRYLSMIMAHWCYELLDKSAGFLLETGFNTKYKQHNLFLHSSSWEC